MCQVCAESIMILVSEAKPGTFSSGEPSGLKGLGQSVSCRQEAERLMSYQSWATYGMDLHR